MMNPGYLVHLRVQELDFVVLVEEVENCRNQRNRPKLDLDEEDVEEFLGPNAADSSLLHFEVASPALARVNPGFEENTA